MTVYAISNASRVTGPSKIDSGERNGIRSGTHCLQNRSLFPPGKTLEPVDALDALGLSSPLLSICLLRLGKRMPLFPL